MSSLSQGGLQEGYCHRTGVLQFITTLQPRCNFRNVMFVDGNVDTLLRGSRGGFVDCPRGITVDHKVDPTAEEQQRLMLHWEVQ